MLLSYSFKRSLTLVLGNLFRCLVWKQPSNWDLIFPSTKFVFNNYVNHYLDKTSFGIVVSYFPDNIVALVSLTQAQKPKPLKIFVKNIHDLHAEIGHKIAIYKVDHKFVIDVHHKTWELKKGDYVMIWLEHFP